MREHVDKRQALQVIAALHKVLQVAALRLGVAAYVRDAPGGEAYGRVEELRRRAGSGWVDGEHVDATPFPRGLQHELRGVFGDELARVGQTVELGVCLRIDDAGGVALNAQQGDGRAALASVRRGAQSYGSAAAIGVHEDIALC